MSVMNRYKAALIHLSISASALLFLSLVALTYWYPHPHYNYEGALEILGLIVMVDVIIGPIITLIVFAPNKPSLKFDLSTIAIIQIAAFIYGAYIIGTQYPAYMVYAQGQITVVPAALIDHDKIPMQSIRHGFHPGPRLVMAAVPDDPELQLAFLQKQLADGIPMAWWPEFYLPYAPSRAQIENDAIDVEGLMKTEMGRKSIVEFLARHQLDREDIYLLRLENSLRRTIIVLARQDLQPIGYLDIPA